MPWACKSITKPFMKLLDPPAHNDQECTDLQKFTNKMCLAVLFF